MKNRTPPRAQAQASEPPTQLEGMEVDFDEKATLFPVDLEEVRESVPKGQQRTSTRSPRSLH